MASIALEKVRNIGISAHIDSGKTTLTERILFYTGKIHAIHEVAARTASAPRWTRWISSARRASRSSPPRPTAMWNDYNINIIDTPGHVDFTIEVERALRVLDGAILVLCSVVRRAVPVDHRRPADEALQAFRASRSSTRWTARARTTSASPTSCKEKLGHHAVTIQLPIGAEDQFQGIIDPISMKAFYFDGENGENIREEEIPAEYRRRGQDSAATT